MVDQRLRNINWSKTYCDAQLISEIHNIGRFWKWKISKLQKFGYKTMVSEICGNIISSLCITTVSIKSRWLVPVWWYMWQEPQNKRHNTACRVGHSLQTAGFWFTHDRSNKKQINPWWGLGPQPLPLELPGFGTAVPPLLPRKKKSKTIRKHWYILPL